MGVQANECPDNNICKLLVFTCIYTHSSYSRPVSNSLGKTLKSCPWKSEVLGFDL